MRLLRTSPVASYHFAAERYHSPRRGREPLAHEHSLVVLLRQFAFESIWYSINNFSALQGEWLWNTHSL